MTILKKFWPWFALTIILGTIGWLTVFVWQHETEKYDIYYLFQDGQRIKQGENPYARVLEGNMYENSKYTTYFPGFIELAAITQQRRFSLYENWLTLWRAVFLACNLAITALLFWKLNVLRVPILALIAALFWAFNRWTMFLVKVSGLDFVPILFLLISLLLLPRRRWWSLFFFGLSLAFKQIGIFLLPLYLIEAYCSANKQPFRQVLLTGLAITAIPLISSLPFLFWNFKGFVLSILFSVTRSQFQFMPPAESVDMLMRLTGITARLPMLLMMGLVFWAAWRYGIHIYISSMLVMAIFVEFNSIFFAQYVPWFLMLLVLSLREFWKERVWLQPVR